MRLWPLQESTTSDGPLPEKASFEVLLNRAAAMKVQYVLSDLRSTHDGCQRVLALTLINVLI